MSPGEEAELVALAATGDLAAFAALVRVHEAPLRRYLARLAGDDGDDLAQETLLAAWRALSQWRGDGSFGGWLRAIATRRFLDLRRRQRIATQPLGETDAPLHHDGSSNELRSTARSPGSRIASARLRCCCLPTVIAIARPRRCSGFRSAP